VGFIDRPMTIDEIEKEMFEEVGMNIVALLLLVSANMLATTKESKEANDLELIAVERQIVERTNRERERYGLPELEVDRSLMKSARTHAAWMARRTVLQHTSAAVGENIAQGQSSATEAVRDWMNSPGHRANILSSRYSRIGVAAYRGPDGQAYWCQQFLW
jgi:uncharacterized protein YkwD